MEHFISATKFYNSPAFKLLFPSRYFSSSHFAAWRDRKLCFPQIRSHYPSSVLHGMPIVWCIVRTFIHSTNIYQALTVNTSAMQALRIQRNVNSKLRLEELMEALHTQSQHRLTKSIAGKMRNNVTGKERISNFVSEYWGQKASWRVSRRDARLFHKSLFSLTVCNLVLRHRCMKNVQLLVPRSWQWLKHIRAYGAVGKSEVQMSAVTAFGSVSHAGPGQVPAFSLCLSLLVPKWLLHLRASWGSRGVKGL